MGIKGLTKSTLIDYPGHTTATLFVGGCQFKCPFCHNGTLVTKPNSLPDLSRQELFSFLETRKGLVDSICITGGEPTLYKDLKRLIYDIKQMDFLVKLDTNGYEPYQLDQLLKENLVDYISMDIKNCLEKTPPELAGDIIQNGIVLAGGGSLVRGMDTLISEKTGIPVIYAEDPLSSIVLGAGKALENIDLLSKVEYGHKISR